MSVDVKGPARAFALTSGEVLDGKYRIESLLGEGGMGAVYRAAHLGTQRTVALKIIRPRFAGEDEFVARFQREAEAAGRLRHPNVVDVTDFGVARTASGLVAYLVMEYLDGCTLAEVLAEEGRLPVRWAIEILEQVCLGVDEAHARGVVHRDLKPGNIWLEPNRRGGYTVKLLDFGLARLSDSVSREPAGPVFAAGALASSPSEREPGATRAAEQPVANRDIEEEETLVRVRTEPITTQGPATTELTRVGSVIGTPLYMSPEQCRGEALDARSDIYSLGVIAYQMLAGAPPFTGSSEDVLRQHTTAVPSRPPRRFVPRRLSAVVLSALEKDREQRPQSAGGFGSALRAASQGPGTLLQKAVALYSERFPAFLRLSLLAHVPLMVVVALLAVADGLVPAWGVDPEHMKTLGPVLVVAMVGANLLAYGLVSAVAVPIVLQSILAPLRAVDLKTAFRAVGRRWRTFTLASTVAILAVFAGFLLAILPGALAATAYSSYAPVVVVERLGVRLSLRRARRLFVRAPWSAFFITCIEFALPVAVWLAVVTPSFTFRFEGLEPRELRFGFSMSGRSALWQLLNVLVAPLAAIMNGLLYLRLRESGAESLRDATETFDALALPHSKWQARVWSRAQSTSRASE